MAAGDGTLAILGATGYTGRLCAEEAVARGLPVVLAGRRRDALEALRGDLAARAGAAIDVRVADVHDRRALARLAEAADVLLTTVGPYLELGIPVVEAALAAGTPLVDVSGEVPYLEEVVARHEQAVAAGVALCPGFGYDGVPGELLAAACAADLGGPVTRVRVAYAVAGGAISAGTARSAFGMVARGGASWLGGRLVAEPAGVDRWDVPFPDGPAGAVSLPLPEVVSIPRSLGADRVRSYMVVPAAPVLSALAVPGRLLGAAVAASPLRRVVDRALDRLPEGPSAAARARTRTTVLAEVTGPAGVRTAWARVDDPYGTTALVAVWTAERLLGRPGEGAGETAGGAIRVPAGVLAPSQLAGDPTVLLDLIAGERGAPAAAPA